MEIVSFETNALVQLLMSFLLRTSRLYIREQDQVRAPGSFVHGKEMLTRKYSSGSVIAYLNSGSGDTMSWNPVNGGKEIASGVASRERIRFVDIGEKAQVSNFLDSMTKTRSDMDGKDDYVIMGNQTASATVYLNRGPKQGAPGSWIWDGPHEVAPGAPGARGGDIVFADINNDGMLASTVFAKFILTFRCFHQDAPTTSLWTTRLVQLELSSILENRTPSMAYNGLEQVRLLMVLDPMTSQ